MNERALGYRTRLTPTELRTYWEELSRQHLGRSDDGLEVICYAGMPSWLNRFMHRYQLKAFARLLRGQEFAGCRVLDIGTGVGRWARWYAAWPGSTVVGIDIECERLRRAASLDGGVHYELMSADRLAFPARSFDVVNCVTVLQHVDDDAKVQAIDEFARVLRPGGRAILFEVTDLSDDASHVFPWAEEQWRSEFAFRGFRHERTVGQQYIPILRLFKRGHSLFHGAHSRPEIDALKGGRAKAGDKLKMLALRAAVLASYPIEEVCRFLPSRAARITGFLFEREN